MFRSSPSCWARSCCWFRAPERKNKVLLALGVSLAALAALLRQTGMLIPVAFGIGYLSRGRAGTRRALFAVGFFLLTIAAFVVYSSWLSATGRLPTGYYAQWAQVRSVFESGLPGIARQVVHSLLITYIYLGIFTLPFGLLFISRARKRRLLLLSAVSAVLLVTARLLHVGFPGNILSDRGVGPFPLAHTDEFSTFSGSVASEAVLGLLALFGGTLLLEMLVRSVRNSRS